MRLRKNMKRTAAAVLALSMAVSAVAAPASAAYICDVSQGSVEVSVNEKGEKTIKVGDDSVTIKTDGTKETTGNGIKEDGDGTEDIVITGDNTKPTESLNAEEENTSEAEKSGETEGEGKTQNSAVEGEDKGDEPTSQELLAPEDEQKETEQKETDQKKDEQKPAETQETEQDKKTEKTSDQVIEYGQYDPEAQQEATKLEAKPVVKQETEEKKPAAEVSYEATNAPTSITEKAQAAARNVVTIINNSRKTLKVILRDLKVDAGDTGKNAVTIEGSGDASTGDVMLELDGKNELISGSNAKPQGSCGLSANGNVIIDDANMDGGTLTATGRDTVVTGEVIQNGKVWNGQMRISSGSGIHGVKEIKGGTIIAKGGDVIIDVEGNLQDYTKVKNINFSSGAGLSAYDTVKISGGIVDASGGDIRGKNVGGYEAEAGNGMEDLEELTGGTVQAKGGSVLCDAANIIRGGAGVEGKYNVKLSGGTLVAKGGDTITEKNTGNSYGGDGFHQGSRGNVNLVGSNVTLTGGDGKTGGDGLNNKQYSEDKKTTITGGNVTVSAGKGNTPGKDINTTYSGTINDENVSKVDKTTHTHNFTAGETVKSPTCTSEGYKLKKCECGAEELEHIAIDKDAHSWVESEHKDATCTEDGYTEYKCSACGETEKRDVVTATGEHHFTVVKEVVAPTYTSEGYTIYKCETCDETEKRDVVPMLVPESNGGSSSGSSAVTLTVTGAGAYETSIADGRYIIAVPAETAVLSGCLGNLRELKARDVTTIVFRTQLRETALNIDSMLSLGVDGTLFVLTHSGESAELTVGGVAHNELLH